jgi:hypothetical protein
VGALPFIRFFRLSEDGVRCGTDGLAVGPTPLLRCAASGGWAARPLEEAEAELTALYGLPIDLAGKQGGLATVAGALDRGDAALAAIAAVLLGFPDPPGLAKDAPAPGSAELAAQLAASGLLKDWDSTQHPRAGCPPNRGWFAAKPADARALLPGARRGSFVIRRSLLTAQAKTKTLLAAAEEDGVEGARWALSVAPEVRALIEGLIYALDPTPLNEGEQQILDQIRAAADPPKTLVELQRPPTDNLLGYQRHHSVEQNPDNLAKSAVAATIDKFGRAAVDDSSNIVWVPTLKHQQITGYYNSLENAKLPGIRHRDVVNELDFAGQRDAGLEALCLFGVLQ